MLTAGNPQWLNWVRDFQEEASEKGLTSAQAFQKAARSLSKCPVKMIHPDQALELENVGPIIVKKLIAKLKEYCKETGEPFPERIPQDTTSKAAKRKEDQDDYFGISDDEEEPEKVKLARAKKRKAQEAKDDKARAPPKPKPPPKAPKAKAVPKQRPASDAAAAAALKRFLGSEDRDGDDDHAAEIAARERMNAANSSSSRNRDLVAKPAAQGDYASQGVARSKPPAVEAKKFEYFYLDSGDQRKKKRDDAEVGQDDNGQPIVRIEYRARQADHMMAQQLLNKSPLDRNPPLDLGGKTLTGFMRLRIAADPCPGMVDDVIAPGSDPIRSNLLGGYKSLEKFDKAAMYAPPAGVQRLGAWTGDRPAASTSDISRTKSAPTKSTRRMSDDDEEDGAGPSKRRVPGSQPIPARARSAHNLPPLPPGQHPYESDLLAPSSAAGFVAPVFAPLIVPAASFKVILLVDTRELAGSKQDRTAFVRLLGQAGVEAEQKMLPLGDMVWVARRIHPDGSDTGEEDIMLDAIVERKRLDDLAKSITDGRYTEQKNRILNSGIPHRIYLIEEYDVATQQESWGKQIWTAKSQLQVNDGFYTRESLSINESISFLEMRTQIMEETRGTEDLYVIPNGVVNRANYLALQQHLRSTQPARNYLTTYSAFESLNRTDSVLSLRMQWGTMVQCMKGVSAEKAVQLVERWSTPASFFAALDQRRREDVAEKKEEAAEEEMGVKKKGKGKKKKEPEDYIADQVTTGSSRDIKGALSGKFYHLFTRKKYVD